MGARWGAVPGWLPGGWRRCQRFDGVKGGREGGVWKKRAFPPILGSLRGGVRGQSVLGKRRWGVFRQGRHGGGGGGGLYAVRAGRRGGSPARGPMAFLPELEGDGFPPAILGGPAQALFPLHGQHGQSAPYFPAQGKGAVAKFPLQVVFQPGDELGAFGADIVVVAVHGGGQTGLRQPVRHEGVAGNVVDGGQRLGGPFRVALTQQALRGGQNGIARPGILLEKADIGGTRPVPAPRAGEGIGGAGQPCPVTGRVALAFVGGGHAQFRLSPDVFRPQGPLKGGNGRIPLPGLKTAQGRVEVVLWRSLWFEQQGIGGQRLVEGAGTGIGGGLLELVFAIGIGRQGEKLAAEGLHGIGAGKQGAGAAAQRGHLLRLGVVGHEQQHRL